MTGGLKVYDLPYTLTKGGPGFSTFTITQTIIQNGVSQAKFGQACRARGHLHARGGRHRGGAAPHLPSYGSETVMTIRSVPTKTEPGR